MQTWLARLRALRFFPWALVDGPGFFDHLAARTWYHEAASLVFDALQLRPEDHLVDLGSGPGRHALRAAALTGEVTGLERSAAMLARAERNRLTAGVKNLRFLRGDALHLPFPDQSIDAITGFMLLPVLEAPGDLVGEVLRVLRPGRKACFLVPSAALTPASALAFGEARGFGARDRDTLVGWSLTGRRFSGPSLATLVAPHPQVKLEVLPLLDGLALGALLSLPAGGPV